MSRFSKLVAVSAVLALASTAVAGEIYKWTDENGNAHYVDRPTGAPTEERVDILSSRTNSAAVQASVRARQERRQARDEARAERAEQEQAAAEERAERERQQQRCERYRAQLETMLYSRRLYRENEEGEREYLSDEEALTARTKLQDKIQEDCS